MKTLPGFIAAFSVGCLLCTLLNGCVHGHPQAASNVVTGVGAATNSALQTNINQPIVFGVTATGTPPLSYQWYVATNAPLETNAGQRAHLNF